VRVNAFGVPQVHDLKCGKPSALQMIHDHAVQIAAYTHGAKSVWPNVQPGKLIRAYGYRARGVVGNSPEGVFISMPFTDKDIDILLDNIRLHIALLRMGDIQLNPGSHCCYCEHNGLSNCVRVCARFWKARNRMIRSFNWRSEGEKESKKETETRLDSIKQRQVP
jgi:hypothetical protein